MIHVFFRIGVIILAFLLCLPLLTDGVSAADRKTIGVVMIPNIPYFEEIHKAFTSALASGGVTEDEVEIITLKPLPDPLSLTNTVRKFSAIDANIIVTYGTPSAIAAIREQSKIPVVFAAVFNPETAGISLKNATGISSRVTISTLVKNLKIISGFSKLGIVYSDTEKDTVQQADEVKALEGKIGFSSVRFNIRTVKDVSQISGVDALFLTTSCPATYCMIDIMDLARRAKIPTAALLRGHEEYGAVIVQAADPGEQGREAAQFVTKLMNGADVSSLPVKYPTKVDLIVNIKAASGMGLKVPFDILNSATKVIQ